MKTLAERIKNLPQGTKLYSPCYGEVEFIKTDNNGIYCHDFQGYSQYFCINGGIHLLGECMLFPSKEYRDWNKFLADRNKFDVRTLQPFDKVLARDLTHQEWSADLFSHYRADDEGNFMCSGGYWLQCVPYNDDTKHLLGTTSRAPEYYITWKE